MNLIKLNEELLKLLEENNTYDITLKYLEEVGIEKHRNFFILDTKPEIRAWGYWSEKKIVLRCDGNNLDVIFADDISIENIGDKLKVSLPITTSPEDILKKAQEIFASMIEKKKKEAARLAEIDRQWNAKVRIWEKEWNDNLKETTEIFKALKENGFNEFIFTYDRESSASFGGNSPEELIDSFGDYTDYEPDTRWYAGSVEDDGLIIGDWSGTVSGTYLAGDPDNLYDIDYEDERAGDIYLSEETKDFILDNFPDSYLAKCFKEN